MNYGTQHSSPLFRIVAFMMLSVCFGVTGKAAAASLPATTILDKVVASLRSAPSLTMKMVMRSGSETVNADFTLAKEKFTFKAGSMNVFYDGKTQWTVDSDAREVSITEPTADELAETNPLAFVQNYKKNYKVEKVAESGGTFTVKMTALRKSSYIRSAQVVISGKTWLPTHITAVLATGGTLTIAVSSSTKGAALPTTYFRFDTKSTSSYEIIDLR